MFPRKVKYARATAPALCQPTSHRRRADDGDGTGLEQAALAQVELQQDVLDRGEHDCRQR